MKPSDYTRMCKATAIYPDAGKGNLPELMYLALGLGEAGEVQGKIKKYYRDKAINHEAIALELGDVLWYTTLLADAVGYSLEDVMELNIQKLSRRAKSNTLGGSGDDR